MPRNMGAVRVCRVVGARHSGEARPPQAPLHSLPRGPPGRVNRLLGSRKLVIPQPVMSLPGSPFSISSSNADPVRPWKSRATRISRDERRMRTGARTPCNSASRRRTPSLARATHQTRALPPADPFCGFGSTGCAAPWRAGASSSSSSVLAGYTEIARARAAHWEVSSPAERGTACGTRTQPPASIATTSASALVTRLAKGRGLERKVIATGSCMNEAEARSAALTDGEKLPGCVLGSSRSSTTGSGFVVLLCLDVGLVLGAVHRWARRVVLLAHEQAIALKQEEVDVGHLAVGLLGDRDGVGGRVLSSFGSAWRSLCRGSRPGQGERASRLRSSRLREPRARFWMTRCGRR